VQILAQVQEHVLEPGQVFRGYFDQVFVGLQHGLVVVARLSWRGSSADRLFGQGGHGVQILGQIARS
jgi:hypothetical protein